MAAYPWMPLYVAEYLGDTLGLTTEEHGAYCLLIFAYWRRAAPLPDDNKFLASVTKMNRQRWARVRKTIEAYFQITDGSWNHKRIDIELLKASGRYESAKANGRAGGLAKTKLTTTTSTTTRGSSSLPSSMPLIRDANDILNGIGMGNGKNGHTIDDPGERLARFQQKLAAHLGSSGWEIVSQACDPRDPEYQSSLIRCKVAARELGKGWPKQWLKT